MFPASSYLMFVAVSVGVVFGFNFTIRVYKIRLTRARKSYQLVPTLFARSEFAFTNSLLGNTNKHERAHVLAVHGDMTLKINGNETRYQIVQVTS
jgi:hypothetical protein